MKKISNLVKKILAVVCLLMAILSIVAFTISDTTLVATVKRVFSRENVEKIKEEGIKSVFLNVVKGNVGSVIAQEFMSFVDSDAKPLASYDEVFSGSTLDDEVADRIKSESHTRLYISAMNILRSLDFDVKNNKIGGFEFDAIDRLVEFLKLYPVDLMVGIMKDIKKYYQY